MYYFQKQCWSINRETIYNFFVKMSYENSVRQRSAIDENTTIINGESSLPGEKRPSAGQNSTYDGQSSTLDGQQMFSGQSSSSICSLRRLLHRKELPKHLQFNPYIDTGYRPLLSAWECVMSLFYVHNETVNIITHGEYVVIVVW